MTPAPHHSAVFGDDGSPTGVDAMLTEPDISAEKPSLQAPMAVRPMAVRPMVVRPNPRTATAAPMAAPKLVRPKAVRPDAHAAMLERLAQDFQNHPPTCTAPLAAPPVEIVNVPPSVAKLGGEDESLSTTASTQTDSVSVLQSPKTSSSGNNWGGQDNPSVSDAKKRLRARRTMSETNLGAALLFFEDMNTEPKQEEPKKKEKSAPAPATPILQRPTPVRPKPLKRSQSQGMLNHIAHDFANLPTQQISVSRAPSAPPPQDPVPEQHQPPPQHMQRAPSVAPQPQPQMAPMPMPQMMPQPQRPRIRRQPSGRGQKPSWYHRVAAKNRLGSIQEDPALLSSEEDEGRVSPLTMGGSSYYTQAPWDRIQGAKKELLHELNQAAMSIDGDNNTPAFQAALQTLIQNYDPSLFDPRAPVLAYHPYQMQMEGVGISAGKPTFPGCIGRNPQGDPMYKLGTMSFDMFRPTELVVSVQGTFCLIDGVDRNNLQEVKNVPKNLQNDVRDGINPVRTYNIVTPFTIEPWRPEFGDKSPNKGVSERIHGVMTTYGFLLPFPTQNRFSVWFTGGSLEVDGTKNEKWFQIFDKKAAPRRTALESSKLLAAKLLMGACVNDEMDANGTLKYTLTRPVASYIDLVYLDNSLQVLRGSSGTVYVHVRLPGGSGAVHQSTYSDQMLPTPVDPLGNNSMMPSPVSRFLL